MMKVKKLIPELRFKGFDYDWNTAELNDFASINPKNTELPNSFIYIDLESVTNGVLLKEERIFKDNSPSRAQRLLEKNDILYQTVRPYQKNNLYFDKTGEYVASTGYAQIRTKNDSKFLFQFLHTEKFVQNVMLRCTGTSYPSINSSDLSRIKISFPSLPEQTKIASFLTAVDDKLHALKQKNALLEQYKKGVMQQLFSGKLRFKDDNDNGDDYPDWEEKKLGEVGMFYSGGTPLTTKRQYFGGTIPFIRSGEINSIKTEQFISEEGLKNSSAKMVEVGDVLYALYGATSGEVGISKINGAINQAVLCIKSKENHYYLYSYLKFEKENIINTFLQGGQGNLSSDIVKKITIPLPSQKEQTKIASFLSAIDEKINQCQAQIAKTEVWKKGLLQQLFI